ncbi:hypothetical protein A6P39_45255 [Streptomyces sp. FXJ1.172]
MRAGGAGTTVAQGLQEAGIRTPVRAVGVTDGFPRQATRAEIVAEAGLTAQAIAHTVTQTLARAAVTAVPTGPPPSPHPKGNEFRIPAKCIYCESGRRMRHVRDHLPQNRRTDAKRGRRARVGRPGLAGRSAPARRTARRVAAGGRTIH